MSNVVDFPGATLLDISPSTMLSNLVEEELESVVVVGCRKDGSTVLASSTGDLYKMLWFLEVGKLEVLNMAKE